ncbi:sodium:solute symporter family transporter [Neomicrococcus lactis]|uniref:Na+(H+)/acetate symporter ActP n=1 Tax=Neomicrococcus lactis TaxID=732241 RepID=A0A7W8YAW5_9MICC|nr:Na+(H+)/acetate symporter ActP [Neomicrococcus lactis]
MTPQGSLIAILVVCASTVIIAVYGLRFSRTTSDFYVASRTVKPWWNASSIGGEYLSAASFLGVAGLIMLTGQDALWFPIGYTAGYLMLLLFVAAPLRRSGAYTLPDFAQIRFHSMAMRTMMSVFVVLVGWLYIIPQLHGAALTFRVATGLPGWAGTLLVSVVVCVTVLAGGMRSITFVQAFQYWLKLCALAIPTFVILASLGASQKLETVLRDGFGPNASNEDMGIFRTISLIIALLLGTLGLPHVLVRFYTNPDGPSARRTTLIVLGLVSFFYLFPVTLGTLGRGLLPGLSADDADATVLLLPSALFGGPVANVLSAIVLGGAFAAFLSTSSGLVVSLAGVLSQGLFKGTVNGFRMGALIAVVVPTGLALLAETAGLAGAVGAVFAFTASTIAPVLVLGIWWRGLTSLAAMCAMVTGAVTCLVPLGLSVLDLGWDPRVVDTLTQPAIWSVPAAFAAAVLVSKFGGGKKLAPETVDAVMRRLHVPEDSNVRG